MPPPGRFRVFRPLEQHRLWIGSGVEEKNVGIQGQKRGKGLVKNLAGYAMEKNHEKKSKKGKNFW